MEGVWGRLLVDGMTAVLNYPGTCVLVAALLLIAVLLSTAFSFSNLRQWLAVRFAFVYAWRDRWRNWQLPSGRKGQCGSTTIVYYHDGGKRYGHPIKVRFRPGD